FQAEDGIRDGHVTGVQTCALPIWRMATKRGGSVSREPLDESHLEAPAPDEQLLAVNEALDELAKSDDQAATLVKLRFFGGLTVNEAADALGISVRSAHDLWTYARSWLRRQMRS